MSSKLADKLQVWGLEENNIIFTDGSLGFCLEINPVDSSCWDEYKANDFREGIKTFLNSLPSGINLQFIQEIKAGNDKVIAQNKELCLKSNSPEIKELGLQRVQMLNELDEAGLLPLNQLKFLVRKPLSKPLVKNKGLFSNTKLFPEIAEENFEAELRKLNRIKSDIISTLKTTGLDATTVKADEIAEELYAQWNPCRSIGLDSYDPSNIRDSILFTDVVLSENSFSMSDMHYRVISLKALPSQTFSTMASCLRSLPFDSKLFLSVDVPDQAKEIESLQTNRRLAFSMVHGKTSGVADLESEAKLTDLEELISELISQGEKVFHFGLNVLLRSKDKDQLEEQVSETLMCIRELSGAEGMEETIASFDIFSSFSFPNTRLTERKRRIKTSNLADLLPLYAPWTGHDEPKIILRSRMGNLFKFNAFSRSLTNANQIVSGGSGSGKSYLTNLLLLQMLKDDPMIFIVDIGGSYQKACDNLSGQYIPLGLDGDLTINPFDLPSGETIPSNEKVKFLLALIESMTKEETDSGLKKLERSEIEQAIIEVYEKFNKPRLSHLKETLSQHENIELKRIGQILNSWCGDTPYGRFLDRESTVDFERSVVCFDLKGLEQYPDLQRSCLLLISDLVLRTVQVDRSRMKFLVFDECWALLEGEGANFIGSIFRTCRKYFLSCVAISQNIDDFARSKVATAIMSNSSIKWVLKQKGADKTRLKEVLELNDSEVGLISSLHQEKGVYSEAFLICEDKKSVVVIEGTPSEYWLATTDPKDLTLLEKERLENPELSQMELIFKLAEEYPKGANA